MLELHALWPRSRANGPGVRFVVWFQGCTLGCPGCFNPETHATTPRLRLDEEVLAQRLAAERGALEGLTLSGGEPLQQPEGLLRLLRLVRESTDLSVILFSGYSIAEIERQALGPAIVALADVVIAGRYVASRRVARGVRGSANKQVRFVTSRYRTADLARTPEAEIRLDPDGTVHATGIDGGAALVQSAGLTARRCR